MMLHEEFQKYLKYKPYIEKNSPNEPVPPVEDITNNDWKSEFLDLENRFDNTVKLEKPLNDCIEVTSYIQDEAPPVPIIDNFKPTSPEPVDASEIVKFSQENFN